MNSLTDIPKYLSCPLAFGKEHKPQWHLRHTRTVEHNVFTPCSFRRMRKYRNASSI